MIKPLPRLVAGLLAATLAWGTVATVQAKTPAAQRIISMSHPVSLDLAAVTGLPMPEVNANPYGNRKPNALFDTADRAQAQQAQQGLPRPHQHRYDALGYIGHSAATTRYKDVHQAR